MSDKISFPWKKTFVHYALEKTWILAYILIGIFSFVSSVHNIFGGIAGIIGTAVGAIILGFFGGFIFITIPVSVICTLLRRIFNRPYVDQILMTDAECLAAIEETMQNISNYAEIISSAKAGDKDAQQKAWSDDQFMRELQANILTTTGAQMSWEETRRYFYEWYLAKKEN